MGCFFGENAAFSMFKHGMSYDVSNEIENLGQQKVQTLGLDGMYIIVVILEAKKWILGKLL